MPKRVHRKLARRATKKNLTGERRRRYIWGGLRKTGWKPPKERR